eukprot:4706004-Pleurochrysis_carterae.AAC.1
MDLEEDEELGVTDAELAAEAEEVPQMMEHAGSPTLKHRRGPGRRRTPTSTTTAKSELWSSSTK